MSIRYHPSGKSASQLVADVEHAIGRRALRPGDTLPAIRALASRLDLSPGTVASAYRQLRDRGLVTTRGRSGTTISGRPPVSAVAVPPPVPAGVRDLSTGNPDPRLLPSLGPALRRIDRRPRLYDEPANMPELVELARARLRAEGVSPSPITIVSGALDGIERVLQAHLRPGDPVAVEDPAYAAVLDLLGALGMRSVPVAIDEFGPLPESMGRVMGTGVRALVLTPRAHNPTGAAVDRRRAAELRAVLDQRPDLLVVEDDHGGVIAGARLARVGGPARPRWAFIHSVSKFLGPDLRLAVLTGDADTVARVEGRRLIGQGWVSHILQQTVHALWSDPRIDDLLRRAASTYTRRRHALIEALAERGIRSWGRSGLNVWVPVTDEPLAVQVMFEAGWAVRSGGAYRIRTGPAIRITTAALNAEDVKPLVDDVARAVAPSRGTRSA